MMKYLYIFFLSWLIIPGIQGKSKYKTMPYPTDKLFIRDAFLSVDEKLLACTDDNKLKVFNTDDHTLAGNFTLENKSHFLCVTLSSDNTFLAGGSSDSAILIWNLRNHEICHKLQNLNGKITSICFSPDNRDLLIGCSDSKSYLYNIENQKITNEITGQQKDVTCVTYSGNGALIAVTGGDKIIRIYRTSDYKLQSELRGHTDWVRDIQFYDDSRKLISGGDDGKIIHWNLLKNKNQKTNASEKNIVTLDYSEDSENKSFLSATGFLNGKVIVHCLFGAYTAKFPSPVSKIILLYHESEEIKLIISTLGSGIVQLNASDMQMIN